jgi:hypothetical protein
MLPLVKRSNVMPKEQEVLLDEFLQITGNLPSTAGVRLNHGVKDYLRLYGVEHLYYMAHLDNVSSILDRGILSHNKVKELTHYDFSLGWMQEQREKIVPVSGKPLHDYAPLYFATHTPMQYILTHENKWDHPVIPQPELVFIRVDPVKVFKSKNVVFTDGNAGRFRANFYRDLANLDKLDWQVLRRRKNVGTYSKLKKCAEVLVPDVIPTKWFTDVVVYSEGAYASVVVGWMRYWESDKGSKIVAKNATYSEHMSRLPCSVVIDESLYHRK